MIKLDQRESVDCVHHSTFVLSPVALQMASCIRKRQGVFEQCASLPGSERNRSDQPQEQPKPPFYSREGIHHRRRSVRATSVIVVVPEFNPGDAGDAGDEMTRCEVPLRHRRAGCRSTMRWGPIGSAWCWRFFLVSLLLLLLLSGSTPFPCAAAAAAAAAASKTYYTGKREILV